MNPLTIYPKHPSAPDTYYIGGGWSPACITAVDKRFTDAELAAEYWAAEKWLGDVRAIAETYPGYAQIEPTMLDRVLTLHRMITNPAHDENPA